MLRAAVAAVLLILGAVGCGGGGGGTAPFTPAAARAILQRCARDAAPFVVEYRKVQLFRFPPAEINAHSQHALQGQGRAQTAAADALAKLKLRDRSQAEHVRGYVAVLRRLGQAQVQAGALTGKGDYGRAGRVLEPAQRPLMLLSYRVSPDLERLGALRCLTPRPTPTSG